MSEIHDEIRSLIAAYALDAVPEDEIPAIRAHILSCETCFAEAESYAESVAALAGAVDPAPVSAGFEDATVRAAAPETAAKGRTRRRLNLRSVALAGGALAVGAGVAVAAFWIRGSLDHQRAYEQAVAALVQDRDPLELQGPGGAKAVLASTAGGSVLVALDLGEAPDGRDYQLWLMRDGVPTPAATFDVSASIAVVQSGRPLDDFDGAAVTVEPDGGSSAPTTDPVLSST